MSRPSGVCSIRSAAPMQRSSANQRVPIDVGKPAFKHQGAMKDIGTRSAPLFDDAQDLLDQRGEMKTVDLRRLAPFLEHQLGHGGRLEQVEKKPVEQRRILLGLVLLDVDANDGGFAFLSAASAQPLGQRSSRTREARSAPRA